MATPRASEHRDLEQRFRSIESKLRDLATAALRRPKYEVSDGDLTINGGDLVVDGGDFLLLDTDGSTVFRLGPQLHGDRGVSIFREDATPAFTVRKLLAASSEQNWQLHDNDGNVVASEAVFGSGLERPFLPLPFQPYLAVAGAVNVGPHGHELPVSSGTWTTTHVIRTPRINQFAQWRWQIGASDAATAGEVRVLNESTAAGLTTFGGPEWIGARAAGGTGYTEVVSSPLVLPGLFLSSMTLAVQTRRTAGTGTLNVALVSARGASS